MMSVNAVESENMQLVAHKSTGELIYRLEDRLPSPQILFVVFQYLLAMFVVMITPALLIYQTLGLPTQDIQHIVSMSPFTSGVASIIQIKVWDPADSGLLSIQGIGFSLVTPLTVGGTALKTGGVDVPTMMTALFGTLMLASCTEVVFFCVLHLTHRIITPLVPDVVVMIIGLSLIRAGLTSIGGGYTVMVDHVFSVSKNLLLAGIVLALIITLNRQHGSYSHVVSLVIVMAAGHLVAWLLDMLSTNTAPTSSSLITVLTSLYYGLGIDWSLLLPLMLVSIITSLRTISDIIAISDISEQPASGPLYMKRLKSGVLTNGLNSLAPAVFNTFPDSCFDQNNGAIQLTGVASRYVGFMVTLMLIVLGLFPAVSGFVQHVPEPMSGGVALVMFGTIIVSGVRIVSREPPNCRVILIIALPLVVGLGVSQQSLILQFVPDWSKNPFSSGVAAGGITVIALDLIFPSEKA